MDVTKLLPGINLKAMLAAVGVVLLLLVGTGVASYHVGKSKAKVEIVEKEVEKVVEREKKMVEYVEKRVPVVQYIDRENIKYVYVSTDTKERLNEAIAAADAMPQCVLTDDEWRLFNEATRAANAGGDLPAT